MSPTNPDVDLNVSYHGNMTNLSPHDLRGDDELVDSSLDHVSDDISASVDHDDEVNITTAIPTKQEKKERSDDINISYHGNMKARLGLTEDLAAHKSSNNPYDLREDDEDEMNAGKTPVPTKEQTKNRSTDLNFSYHGNMNARLGVDGEKEGNKGSTSCRCTIQ
uniref:Uncharacterized protein n=1 Tax=Chaetoceros debilis TaxID=122233 RepID=A0A7S3PWR3_9STRA|mmetsp:Transcript_28733/g.43918  ORF Transcript_28733/g.43918 Transcript_28733/m.43918 type:complete len:164 (-) Transcript_28733:79-570(-)